MIENDANELVENILPYEREFFLSLNSYHNPFWNSFMWIYSDKMTWIPLAIVALGVLTYKTKYKYSILFILCIALVFTLCDQLSASLIKPIFQRYRPTHHPDFFNHVLIVNDYKGGRYGFISAHSANGFGIAMFIALAFKYRWLTLTMFTWATVTCYSRIYLGVHFVSDVIGGILLGCIVGVAVYFLLQCARKYLLKESDSELLKSVYSVQRSKILCLTIIVLWLSIFAVSFINFIYNFRWLY